MLNAREYFKELIRRSKSGEAVAICSVCSSNRYVLEAALEEGKRTGSPVLIEATANQINQFGGYTGMQPADFVKYVFSICDKVGFDRDMLILGGDHLGPLVWCGENEESAMQKAEDLVTAFAAAGFQKIHLDCSMRLADDDPNAPLPAGTVARRAARLCAAAECSSSVQPVYVIGSEVPIPGGATAVEDALTVTSPEALTEEYETFRSAFEALGLESAWEKVTAIVVQPGVEFGDGQVFMYDPAAAKALTDCARTLPGIFLEGHSTDYQSGTCLYNMKKDGIGILKVGPALTFAMREALFALESMEKLLYPTAPEGGYSKLGETLEKVMLASPANWRKHYHGDDTELYLMRRFSLSDRCRYYFDNPEVREAAERLVRNINAKHLPFGLIHQFLPRQAEAVMAGELEAEAEALIKENICYVLRTY